MNERQWYQARLRWAVMEEGRGLDHWREAEHIFQSDRPRRGLSGGAPNRTQPGVCHHTGPSRRTQF
jgi:hypothetical protein